MISHPTRSMFLGSLGHATIELCSQFLPVLYPLLIEVRGLTYAQVGVIALVAMVGSSLAQPLFGHLCDLWNPRTIAVLSVAWIGAVMGAVGLMDGYGWLLVAVGVGALGSAAFHPAGASIASSLGKRRGVATSVFSVGGSVGTALSALLISASVGRWGMHGTVVVIPVALLVSALLLLGLGRMEPHARLGQESTSRAPGRRGIAGLVLIVMAVMSLSWFHNSFRTYLPTWYQGQGHSLAAASRLLFALTTALGLGSLFAGTLSDRIGRWQLFALCVALLGPVEWFFLSAGGGLQVALVMLMGLLVGAIFPTSIVMAQDAWPGRVGIASGLVMGLGWLPGGLGASFTGLVADRVSLTAGLRLLIVPALLSAACVIAYSRVQRAPSGTGSADRSRRTREADSSGIAA
jgi:FSR family fosmidomycin resistance protein-like MFS transporter